jgi:hypothetical protein
MNSEYTIWLITSKPILAQLITLLNITQITPIIKIIVQTIFPQILIQTTIQQKGLPSQVALSNPVYLPFNETFRESK